MIKIDNSNIVGVSLGDTQFSKIYKGVDLYWSKTPSLIQVNIEFIEGVTSMTVNGVVYNEPTTIYVDYKSTVVWSATLSDGYEYAITNGTIVINEKKIYIIKAGNPLNEIWYRTSDNQPILLNSDVRINNSNNFKNYYDEKTGYCKIVCDSDILKVNYLFYNNDNLISVDYLPESLEYTENKFLNNCWNLKYINIGNLPNLKGIFDLLQFGVSTNYITKTINIDYIKIGNMQLLEYISSGCFHITSNANSTDVKLTISSVDIGDMQNLETIGNYFFGGSCNNTNYPTFTFKVTNVKLGNMQNLETIGDYFFGKYIPSSKQSGTLSIDTITLPSCPLLKEVGKGAFEGITVNKINVPTDCYDLYCELFPNVKSKFVKY